MVNEHQSTNNKIDKAVVRKFIDGKLLSKIIYKNCDHVNESSAFLENDNSDTTDLLKYIKINNSDTTNGNIYIDIYNFTSLRSYYYFGDSSGLEFRKFDSVQSHLKKYAYSHGVISLYETTDSLDADFVDYMNNYIDSAFGGEEEFVIMPTWYYDTYTTSTQSTAGRNFPIIIGHNNSISSYSDMNVYGTHLFYDRTFFRDRLATISGWGAQLIPFNIPGLTFLDNRLSSTIKPY